VSFEQKIRVFLFYLSLSIFLIGLPFILSFALSYKFNIRTLKFTKAGLIDLKTEPPGASIYLDGKSLNEKTPMTINELLPGTYNMRIELDKHYPWFGEVTVEAGKVTRLDKIILFPLKPNIKQISHADISLFWIDEEKEMIYYINNVDNIIYVSNLQGEHFQKVSTFPQIKPPPKKWKISPDKEKLLYFNFHQLAIVYLDIDNRPFLTQVPILIEFPNHILVDIFWHSDNYHLILVTDKTIDVIEASPKATAVNLVNLDKRNTSCFYDERTDTIYFVDSQRAADGESYDNVYKLDLGTKFYRFQDLIKPRSNE
jgi:hypothetical protein